MKKIIFIIGFLTLFVCNIVYAQDIGFGIGFNDYTDSYMKHHDDSKIDYLSNYYYDSLSNDYILKRKLDLLNQQSGQKIFLAAFLNVFPGMGLGSFYQGNTTWGLIQMGLQFTGLIIYGVAFNVSDIDIHHSLTNTGHYFYFGASLIGIISAVIYGVSNP
jgi:TM2 domain-containing membrane protein YozV